MILLIDNYDSFTFNLYHYLSSLKVKVDVIRNDEITDKQIIKNKMMSLAADLGNAASIEQQAQIQNYIVALIGFNEFYDVNQIITDGQFYADCDIYGNIAMPVNKKARRMGLIDQLKFNEMVEQQYKEL